MKTDNVTFRRFIKSLKGHRGYFATMYRGLSQLVSPLTVGLSPEQRAARLALQRLLRKPVTVEIRNADSGGYGEYYVYARRAYIKFREQLPEILISGKLANGVREDLFGTGSKDRCFSLSVAGDTLRVYASQ